MSGFEVHKLAKPAGGRIVTLDLLRTLAIVLMVIFHFIYDLKYFAWVDWGIPDGNGWKHFRYVILCLFFLSVGAGLVQAHHQQFKPKKFFTRLIQVALGAALTTTMSLVMFPEYWIYFGVLHFIVIASLISVWCVPYPKLALGLGLSIILLALLWPNSNIWPFQYISQYLPQYTSDYVPFFPWIGAVLLGISLGYSRWLNNDPLRGFEQAKTLSWPGKHSLVIYLVHQPLLFSVLAPVKWLMQ